jgi:mono/diheme cytochrome c family protein
VNRLSSLVSRGAFWAAIFSALFLRASVPATAEEASAVHATKETPAERGYRLLTTKAYLPADFDQEVFDELWKTWEGPLRSQAEQASPAERRKMAFSRYGLTEAPERADQSNTTALQYVAVPGADAAHLGWAMNCLACHGGKVAGRVIPGVPNSLYGLQTLTEEVKATKLRLGKPLTHMDKGSIIIPLGGSHGTTNAVSFGRLLLSYRDPDLSLHTDRLPPVLVHHDHDAPAWWLLKRKSHLYIDGFAPKSHRALMQFLLIPRNTAEQFRAWEDDYRDILAWIESLTPPAYPWSIDRELAAKGATAFNRVCARCHGTYGQDGKYPEQMVPIDEVGTDRMRYDALAGEGRARYGKSWFAQGATTETIAEPAGYVAPPLDGIWASAPYLHNGSVPTLWHILHPSERPAVWQRTEDGYDQQKVGLEITAFEKLPASANTPYRRRTYFDAHLPGKSAAGHLFPNELTEDEKRAVLEYLKTL